MPTSTSRASERRSAACRTRNRHPERHHRRDHRADLRQRLRAELVSIKQALSVRARAARGERQQPRPGRAQARGAQGVARRTLGAAPVGPTSRPQLKAVVDEIESCRARSRSSRRKPPACRRDSKASAARRRSTTSCRACSSPSTADWSRSTKLAKPDRGTVLLPLKSAADAKSGDWQIVTYRDARKQPQGDRPRGGMARAHREHGLVERRVQLGVLHRWR